MREWCGCGAGIRTMSLRQVKTWRKKHLHDGRPDPEPEQQGSFTDSQIAFHEPVGSDADTYMPPVIARIGFTPND